MSPSSLSLPFDYRHNVPVRETLISFVHRRTRTSRIMTIKSILFPTPNCLLEPTRIHFSTHDPRSSCPSTRHQLFRLTPSILYCPRSCYSDLDSLHLRHSGSGISLVCRHVSNQAQTGHPSHEYQHRLTVDRHPLLCNVVSLLAGAVYGLRC